MCCQGRRALCTAPPSPWRKWIECSQHWFILKKLNQGGATLCQIQENWIEIYKNNWRITCPSMSITFSATILFQRSTLTQLVKFCINPASCSSAHHLSPYLTCLSTPRQSSHMTFPAASELGCQAYHCFQDQASLGCILFTTFHLAFEFVPFHKSPLSASQQIEPELSTSKSNPLCWEKYNNNIFNSFGGKNPPGPVHVFVKPNS